MIKDIFFDKGTFSMTKTMPFLAFFFSSWVVYENVHSQYIVELLALYLGLPYANRHATRYMDIKENVQTFQSQKNIKVDNPDG